METELRRSRSRLCTFGTGVLIFALWDIMKPLLTLLIIPQTGGEVAEIGENAGLALAVVLLIILTLFFVTLGLRIYLGISARAEGMGKPKGKVYMIFAFLVFFFLAAIFAAEVAAVIFGMTSLDPLEIVTALSLEGISMITMGELAFTARKVKRLEKQLREAE